MRIRTLVFMTIIVFLVATLYLIFAGTIEYEKNPLLREDNLEQSYQVYFTGNPLIDGRLYEGNKDAPVTIIAVLDTTSESSKQFYEDTINRVRETYVNDGQAKIYYKYYITQDDVKQKTDRYIKAKDIYCYKEAGGKDITKIHQKVILEDNTRTIDAMGLDVKYEKFRVCINEATPQQVIEDMVETEQYRIQDPSLIIGLDGQDNTVLYGQSSDQILRTAIRNQQIKIGI